MGKTKNNDLEKIRHSSAHVMADAVKRLYPGVKMGIGPAIEDGFYYDFDFSECGKTGEITGDFLTPEDLPAIEKQMREIIQSKLPFKHRQISRQEAVELFTKEKETYKLELIEDLQDENITIYTHGDFTDLCRGPHVENTGEIGAFRLFSVAGAYWKGSEKNPMLQRIYGTAFRDKKELDEYLRLREEALKRDHRKLGKELELFSFDEAVGAGLVIYHPKGALLRQLIVDYITEKHLQKKYHLIASPHILKSDIWIRSGHYDYYKENMYVFDVEGQEFAVKPMNCPGHITVFSSKVRSYRELPLRFFELGSVYRHEKSGVLHGLLRVRGFTQDDAHIFCLREQAEEEIAGVIDFVEETLKDFGFNEYEVELSTRPEKSIGTNEDWDAATEALKAALDKRNIEYEINQGDGAFYGPKIDIKLKDALGRSWQCATVQCDFALPQRFDLKYTDKDGEEKRPIMLHRVILGSLERFIGALIEHYGGNFPLWLAPVQLKIVPITKEQNGYAFELEEMLAGKGFRVETDARNEKMQKKIRDAEKEKIPFMLIVGKKEAAEKTVSVRTKKEGNTGVLTREELIKMLQEEIAEKK